MESVIVQRAARPGVTPRSWSLGPGDSLTLGRGSPEDPVDVELVHPGVPRVAARIDATEDYWLLTNLGREITYVVDDPEGGGEFVRVRPGRSRAPIPFELARLSIPVEGGTVDVLVFAPEHDHGAMLQSQGGEPTVAGFSLDPSARYFDVLVALCEPRLRDPASTAVPSVQDIADELGLGRSAVNFHLEYLAKHKLHVYEREDAEDPGARLDQRRQALVATAMRFGLVTSEHRRRS